jgi:nucleosome binding factor SPN SPT16 subunit
MKKNKFDFVLIPKTKEPEESIVKFLEEVKKEVNLNSKLKIGGFLKEKQKGKMVEEFDDLLNKIDHEWVEISPQIQDLVCIKREEDYALIKKSSKLTEYFFKLLLEQVEDIIDKEIKMKHSDITKKIEKYLVDNKVKYEQELMVKPAFSDLAYAPIIQSGGTYNLKPNAESDDEVLKYDTIMLSVGAKYMEYNTNVVRTLMIDASEEEKQAYNHVYEAERFLIKALKPNAPLKDVYESTFKFLSEKKPSYKDKIATSFGFGVSIIDPRSAWSLENQTSSSTPKLIE